MKKKLVVCFLVLSFIIVSQVFALDDYFWTEGTQEWAQGVGDAWETGAVIFIECRLYNNALEKLDENSATNTDYVYVETGSFPLDAGTCVTIGSSYTY